MVSPSHLRAFGMTRSPALLEAPSCGTCRFWRKRHSQTDADDWGECRRMPPTLPEIGDEKLVIAGIWPCTTSADWCGEWESSATIVSPDHEP